jgi:CBS-domain-containing membrane protein
MASHARRSARAVYNSGELATRHRTASLEETDMSTPTHSSPWLKLLGIELSPVSHRERLVSALGGFVAIFAVYWTSHLILGATASPILVLSMGSTAAMLFAVPHGALSQPWPLLGGHLVSGLIGITCLLYDAPAAAGGQPRHRARPGRHALPALHPPARGRHRAGRRAGRRNGHGPWASPSSSRR